MTFLSGLTFVWPASKVKDFFLAPAASPPAMGSEGNKKRRRHAKPTVSSPAGDEVSSGGAKQQEVPWSKSKKKRMRRLRAKQRSEGSGNVGDDGDSPSRSRGAPSDEGGISPAAPPQATKAAKKKSTALQDAFKARLAGSRFRVLNEELYTMTSSESFDRFSARPGLFEEYHEGR